MERLNFGMNELMSRQMIFAEEQKVFVAGYINKTPGAWREYNGTDFKVVEARIDGNHWKVSFGLYFENYEAQRVDVVIPLSEE